ILGAHPTIRPRRASTRPTTGSSSSTNLGNAGELVSPSRRWRTALRSRDPRRQLLTRGPERGASRHRGGAPHRDGRLTMRAPFPARWGGVGAPNPSPWLVAVAQRLGPPACEAGWARRHSNPERRGRIFDFHRRLPKRPVSSLVSTTGIARRQRHKLPPQD